MSNCPRPKVRNPRTQKCVLPDSRALRFSGYYNGGVPLHEVMGQMGNTVINPNTGRRIKVGGYTYLKLGMGARPALANRAALENRAAFADAQLINSHAKHQAARRNLEAARAQIRALEGRLAIDAAQLGALEEARVALEAHIADLHDARRSATRQNAAARRNDAARARLQATVEANVRKIQNLKGAKGAARRNPVWKPVGKKRSPTARRAKR